MPATVTAVRAFLVADAQHHPLPSPQPIDLATDVIPYGARVRLEVELVTDEPLAPLLDAQAFAAFGGEERAYGSLSLFPSGSGNSYAVESDLPWGAFWCEEHLPCPDGAPRLPLRSGWPTIPGGEHILRFPASLEAAADTPMLEARFRIGEPPGAGGATPRIAALGPDLSGDSIRVGQPWLLTARTEDADDDVVAVLFTVVRGGWGRLWQMCDDGTFGDEQKRDGVYSVIRVGGDWWDQGEMDGATPAAVTVTAQAVDLRGNWSEPAAFQYRLRYDEAPVWMEGPDPAGPNVLEAGLSREEGLPDYPLVWARCDSPDARVCVRIITQPGEVWNLLDDGMKPDRVAGDGIHTNTCWLPRTRYWDLVFYAVPKRGPLIVGRKVAVTCPPPGEGARRQP